jgi:hypothetical protein
MQLSLPVMGQSVCLQERNDGVGIWAQVDPSAQPFNSEKGDLYIKLDKHIYRLKQSSLKFQQHLQATLTSIGYKQCIQDECIYTKSRSENSLCILTIHAYDILQVIIESSEEE